MAPLLGPFFAQDCCHTVPGFGQKIQLQKCQQTSVSSPDRPDLDGSGQLGADFPILVIQYWRMWVKQE